MGRPQDPDRDDDAALVRRAVAGDRSALERLLRRHEPRLRLLCRRMCASAEEAEDALQDAMIAIVRGLPRFDGRAAFGTWAYRVATNACVDELRRRRRRAVPTVDLPESSGVDPQDDAGDERADRDQLLAALAALPEEFRAPVVLRDVLDLDYAQIAETLDLAPGTVRSRIARGRARLLESLTGNRAPSGTVQRGEPS